MTVVINELEVVLPAEEKGAPGQPPAAAAPPLVPMDVAALLERRARQELRLFAH